MGYNIQKTLSTIYPEQSKDIISNISKSKRTDEINAALSIFKEKSSRQADLQENLEHLSKKDINLNKSLQGQEKILNMSNKILTIVMGMIVLNLFSSFINLSMNSNIFSLLSVVISITGAIYVISYYFIVSKANKKKRAITNELSPIIFEIRSTEEKREQNLIIINKNKKIITDYYDPIIFGIVEKQDANIVSKEDYQF